MKYVSGWLLCATLALSGCSEESGLAPWDDMQGDADGSVSCAVPNEGCPCGAEDEPVDCYVGPATDSDGNRVCGEGTRYCKGTSWGACESIRSYSLDSTPGAAQAALSEGPANCNPCDPTCAISRDYPSTPEDIEENGNGVILDPNGNGITLPGSSGNTGTLPDRDGDGVPDAYDSAPDDPTQNGVTEAGGFFYVLRRGERSPIQPLQVSTQIRTADVYVLMDTTASMAGEISNLRSGLTSGSFLDANDIPVIRATGNESQATAFDLGNDVPVGAYRIGGRTTGMANDYGTSCGSTGTGTSPDAVISFRITTRQTVTLTTDPAVFDTVLALRDGSFNQIACNNNISNSNRASRISATLDPGRYYVVVEGRNGAAGDYVLLAQIGSCSGILGATRCLIPDASFGVGFFREYAMRTYGPSTIPVYQHLQDITSDLDAVRTAVNQLATQGNHDWPESDTQALYSTVTGNGLGSFWPSRTANSSFGACPAGTWGYPCFRDGTIPIILLFTDAPMHNGPNPQFTYIDPIFESATWTSVSNNDTQASAHDLGDITATLAAGNWVLRSGSTSSSGINDDYSNTVLGCNSNTRDVVFKFTLSRRTNVLMSTRDSAYTAIISLFRDSITAANRVECNAEANGVGSDSAIDRTLDPGTYYVVIDGNNVRGTYRLSIGDWSLAGRSDAPVSWTRARNALTASGAKVITTISCEGGGGDSDNYCDDLRADANAVSNATSSVDGDGAPFVYEIDTDGTGLSSSVVEAIDDLANNSRMDITARATDNPATAYDETRLVESISLSTCPATRCAGTRSSTMCGQCLPGTNVGFNVAFTNADVPASTVPIVFDFEIELVGDAIYVLSRIPVRIVVPPAASAYAASGSYSRAYDAADYCEESAIPTWELLRFTANVPTGTRIDFQFRTADTEAGLAAATPVTRTVPASTSPIAIGDALRAGGQSIHKRFLDVTAVLRSNATQTAAPTLTGFELTYHCTTND